MQSSAEIRSLSERAQQPFEQNLLVGFYDLNGYMQWAAKQPPLKVLNDLDRFFEETGSDINARGGLFIKAIGDTGLFIFPAETQLQCDQVIHSVLDFYARTNKWLSKEINALQMAIQMNWGPVACGYVGATPDKRFDIYGETVNTAALINTSRFAISSTLYEKASTRVKEKFEETEASTWELVNSSISGDF